MRALLFVILAGCELEGPFLEGETLDSAETGWGDADGDGYVGADDCDPTDFNVNPGAPERCDGVDNDCDGPADEEDAIDPKDWYTDADQDGYGETWVATSCEDPSGTVDRGDDCDGEDANIHPGAGEACGDGKDNDCDGIAEGCAWEGQYASEDVQYAVIASDEAGTWVGKDVAIPGDLDGDGLADLVIGAPYAEEAGGAKDAGSVSFFTGPLEQGEQALSDADGAWFGAASNDNVGVGLTSLGDLSGEGVVGLGVSNLNSDPYVLLFDLRDALSGGEAPEPDQSISLGSWGQYVGQTAAGGFDLDGDGWSELALGSRRYDGGSYTLTGGAYLLSLEDSGEFVERVTLQAEGQSLDRNPGLATGDLDGDGLADLLVGAPELDQDGDGSASGGVYLATAADLSAGTLDSAGALAAPDEGCWAGDSVAALDADGDGYADLLFGGPACRYDRAYDGGAWLAPGGAGASGDGGLEIVFEVRGTGSSGTVGEEVAGGDLDGDTLGDDELIIGAPQWSEDGSYGAVGLWYDPAEGSYDFDQASAIFEAAGADEMLGYAVASGQDLSGDGLADLAATGPKYGGGYGLVRVFQGLSF